MDPSRAEKSPGPAATPTPLAKVARARRRRTTAPRGRRPNLTQQASRPTATNAMPRRLKGASLEARALKLQPDSGRNPAPIPSATRRAARDDGGGAAALTAATGRASHAPIRPNDLRPARTEDLSPAKTEVVRDLARRIGTPGAELSTANSAAKLERPASSIRSALARQRPRIRGHRRAKASRESRGASALRHANRNRGTKASVVGAVSAAIGPKSTATSAPRTIVVAAR